MCDNYAMVRDYFIKRLKRRFFIFTVFTYMAAFWVFWIPHNVMGGEAVEVNGKTLGQYDVGFASFTCFVLLTHSLFFGLIREWHKIFRILVGIVISLYFIASILA